MAGNEQNHDQNTQIFAPENRTKSARNRHLYAAYELLYTGVDFAAAILFIIGSVMFFSNEWQTPGTWCFLFGSIFFASKPSIRMVREIQYVVEGRHLHDAEDKERNGQQASSTSG